MTNKKCDECDGTGQKDNILVNLAIGVWPVPIFKIICPKCNGTGEIEE